MLLWMAYATVVAGLLGAGGLALERICETLGWPRRLPWLMALSLALLVPLTATPRPSGDAARNRDGTSATGATQVVRPAAWPVAEQERATSFAVPLPTRTDRIALLLAHAVENENYDPENPFSTQVIWREPLRYDVFESDGTYLGVMVPPDGFSPYPNPVFDGDHVWAATRDELGVERVVRYRIVVGDQTP